jgi:sporulation protein YlmC with PRC-barrel domain
VRHSLSKENVQVRYRLSKENTMKKALIAGAALAAMLGTASLAQTQRPGGDARVLSEVPANSVTVTNYYKQSVYDPGNTKIGDIDDTLVGTNDGKISALVIGVGGFLGIGEKHVLVPFSAVQGSMKDNKWTLVMNATKDELKAAPGFKYDRAKTTWIKDEASTTGAR